MAKQHIVTCKYCKIKFDTNTVPYITFDVGKVKRYAHQQCPEGTEGEIQLEKDKDTLASYVKETFGQTIYDDPKTWVQIERYYKQNLTPVGIYNTLVYIYTILKKPLKDGNLGLIPYYYKDAQDYVLKIKKAQTINEEKIAESDNFYKDINVTIKSPQRKKKVKKLFAFLDEEE
jgi:hypothetical protein